MIVLHIIETHPGMTEWGERWAKERGFTDLGQKLERAKMMLPGVPAAGDHVVVGDDDLIVIYVAWNQPPPGKHDPYETHVICQYNGKAS